MKLWQRRAIAGAVSLWLIGWVPTIVYTHPVFAANGPQLYAVWIIIAPLALSLAAAALFGLCCLYVWAFPRRTHAEIEARIAELERELEIPRLSERRDRVA